MIAKYSLKLFTLLIVILVLILSTEQAYAQDRKDLIKQKVSYSSIAMDSSPEWIAKDAGIFQKYGLDIELIYIASGTQVVNTLLSGDVNIATVAASGIIAAILQKADITMVAGTINVYPNSFFVHPSIKTAQDLKGKNIGITRFGSSSHTATVLMMRALGLSDKDYGLIQYGGVPERLAALKGGGIHGTTLSAPTSYRAIKEGFHELLTLTDLKKLGIAFQHHTISVSKAFAKSKPDVVRNFLKAHVEAIKFMHKNKEETKKIIGKYTKITDPEVLEGSWKEYVELELLEKTPYITANGIMAIAKFMVKDTEFQALKPEQFMDNSFVKELDESGFIKDMWK